MESIYSILQEDLIKAALCEDLGDAGDITSNTVIAPDERIKAELVTRQLGRICGLEVAIAVFKRLDPRLEVLYQQHDGADVSPDIRLALIRGNARAILSAERTALNFLSRLSGIATTTHAVINEVSSFPTQIVCTRKTTPGLRLLEKYAVRVGGAKNHRFGLYDAVLIKDNHRLVAGSITEAVTRARQATGHLVKIEVEVDTLTQLQETLDLGVDTILLDNMSVKQLHQAVKLAKGKAITEASGGIGLTNVREIAATGVDVISLGWLTHSAPALDVSLEVVKLYHSK